MSNSNGGTFCFVPVNMDRSRGPVAEDLNWFQIFHRLCESVQVDPNRIAVLGNWQPGGTLEKVLVELRREMSSHQNRSISQPPDGSTY